MRLFTGIRPSDDFLAALAELQERLRAAGITGRYLDPSNLHMTLAFVGEWPEDITQILPPVEHPFTITLASPGIFPEAKVLWAGTEASEELNCLAQCVRDCLAEHGIPFDPKGFNPHITLARKPFVPENVILSEIKVPAVSMIVDDVCLYRSDRGKDGMVYTVIGSSSENEAT